MSTNDSESHAAETEVIDPVCGMIVNPKEAKRRRFAYEDRDYFFCSKGCRKEFKADPEGYLSGEIQRAEAAAASREHVCPLTPTVRQIGPGTCPKCGTPLTIAETDSEPSQPPR